MAVFSRLLPALTTAYAFQAREYHFSLTCIILNAISVCALIFVPQHNEKYYDLAGSLGFLSTTFASLYYPAFKSRLWDGLSTPIPALSSFAPRQLILTAALGIWTARLGTFLVSVCRIFKSRRFVLETLNPANHESGKRFAFR